MTELDDGTLLSCSDDLSITNWNYVSNSSFSFKTTHKDYVYSILKIINTSLIATGSKDLTIKLWNQSYLVSTLYGHLKPVISLLALPYYSDQAIPVLASSSCDTTIKTWNLTSYSLIHTLNAHTGCVNSLALYGSKIMLSGSSDMKIIVWNIINNFEIITYLTGHSNAINSIDKMSDLPPLPPLQFFESFNETTEEANTNENEKKRRKKKHSKNKQSKETFKANDD